MKSLRVRYALAGLAAGVINGFLGGGGGTLLVPLLQNRCALTQKKAFATSVAVIAPLCALSAAIYFFRGGLELSSALPYLVGGLLGGFLGGRFLPKVSALWLRRAFALLLLYGGVRSLV